MDHAKLYGNVSLGQATDMIFVQEIYENTMVKFLYDDAHYTERSLDHATLDYIYSIRFEIDSFDRHKYLELIEEINNFFKDELTNHNFFYLTPGDNGFVLFMESAEEIDDILLKLTTTSQILNQHTKEEYNKSVDEVNLHRRVNKVQDN